jgi:hypothetical protein
MKLAPEIVRLAALEIGIEEIDRTNCGPRVDEYKAATVLPAHESWPWCAAFVCWVVREAMKNTSVFPTQKFSRPRTASAWGFEAWSLAQDKTTNTRKPHDGDIQPGDIVVFTFSHIGIATGTPDRSGYVPTIEGNTDGDGSREGGAVLAKKRHVSKIRSRIRFTV